MFAVVSLQAAGQWTDDILGPGFEQMTIKLPDDYEGEVVGVLVRSLPLDPVDKAVLYIHGFNDYFFQAEQARRYNEQGYAFYAIDLRKYGRSYRGHQKMGNVRNLKEYYPEIDSSLRIIRDEGYGMVILAGHSTGGLIASVYAHDRRSGFMADALVLNSPFLDMNFRKFKEKVGVPLVSGFGAVMPGVRMSSGKSTLYGESVHRDHRGEWDYDLGLKPVSTVPVSFGWTRAIHRGHRMIKKGLAVPVPVLVMHSDKSVYGNEWNEEFTRGDAVLSVDDIHRYAPNIGEDVTVVVIKDGLHDLVLSRADVREQVYRTIFRWLEDKGL